MYPIGVLTVSLAKAKAKHQFTAAAVKINCSPCQKAAKDRASDNSNEAV
jgi:hypothetical protein